MLKVLITTIIISVLVYFVFKIINKVFKDDEPSDTQKIYSLDELDEKVDKITSEQKTISSEVEKTHKKVQSIKNKLNK